MQPGLQALLHVKLPALPAQVLQEMDGVMRFRVIKLKPGVPDAPDMRTATPPRGHRPPR